MKAIPIYFRNKQLFNLIDYQIMEGKKSIDEVEEWERNEIAGVCVSLLGEDAFSCVAENFLPTSNKLADFMKSGATVYAKELAENLCENAVGYLKETIDAIFEDRIYEYNKYMSEECSPYALNNSKPNSIIDFCCRGDSCA